MNEILRYLLMYENNFRNLFVPKTDRERKAYEAVIESMRKITPIYMQSSFRII